MNKAFHRKDVNGPRAPNRWLARTALAAIGTVALTLGLAGHASAAGLASTSATFAGYDATPSGGIASVSATFKVPTINCSDLNMNDEWWGVQVDTALSSDVYGYCDGAGNAIYGFDVEAGFNIFPETGVSPGDTVVTSAWQTATTGFAWVTDLTQGGEYYYADDGASGTLSSAEIGGFNNDSPVPGGAVPPFTTVKFTNCQVNGQYLGFVSPTQYDETVGTVTLVSTGKLASLGDTFKLTYKHES
jgi:hypothetical protein